ncbi:MAG: ABC-2 transporter permease, partial [Clostridia bacterium]|nr:ABC-2 transporter permease [Clostridia bacterium]
MSAVYRRELKANLFSMTGTIFIAFALVFIGLYCSNVTFASADPHLEKGIIVAGFFSLLAVPILTMRSFSEERHSKTDQLLFSLPLTTGDIVLGKFFAMATMLAIPTAVLCTFPLISTVFCTAGSINYGIIYGTILCYFLLGCAVIAICM